jgi:hypothetical protein
MGRAILAVIAGAAVWSVLWIGGTQALTAMMPDTLRQGEPITASGVLVGLIVYSVALSILAGWTTAAVASRNPMPAVWGLAVLQLALGIGFQASAWNLMPIWYHVIFLALLVPATVYGGHVRARRAITRPAFS